MMDLHCLRPWWWLAFVPLLLFVFGLLRHVPEMQAWHAMCDRHLLPHLVIVKQRRQRWIPLLMLLLCAGFMIISLTGPTWSRLPVPTYRHIQPRVVLLDMSDNMLENDLSPNRLSRAKFKLHDVLQQRDIGQVGLIAYTDEPFVVAPLTDDGQTIDELLSSLTPDIMPVKGNRLDRALESGAKLIMQTGAEYGQILVLTSQVPTSEAIAKAQTLARRGITVSVMPMQADKTAAAYFTPLAQAGQGKVISYTDTSLDIQHWIKMTQHQQYSANLHSDFPVWRDQGRWFIIPALVLLLPVFRRGWLQRIST